MNYKDLPLDQRMEMASQYALLLVADDKPDWEIIGILKTDYALTEEQAIQAIGAMRTNYKNEYNSTVRSNLFKALGVLGFSLFAFLFYYFLGKELGPAGIISFIFAILFGIGGVTALFMIGRMLTERFRKPATAKRPAKPVQELDNVDKALQFVAIASGLFLSFTGYDYFFQARIVDVIKIVTVPNCIITEPVKYEHTGGKSRSYYYVLKIRGSNLDYRFSDSYYKYSNGAWFVSELKEGDTVSIQLINKDYLNFYQYPNNAGKLDIINLGKRGQFLVDHGYRNASIRTDQKSAFYLFLVVFAGVMPVIFFKHLYNNKKRRP